MPGWSRTEEVAARVAFDQWRYFQDFAVSWDWADMSQWERQQWVEHAKTPGRDPRLIPPSLCSNTAAVRARS